MAEATKEEVLEIPRGFDEAQIEHQHMAQKGEAIVTCNYLLTDLPKAIAEGKYICPNCATTYKVTKAA